MIAVAMDQIRLVATRKMGRMATVPDRSIAIYLPFLLRNQVDRYLV
jgi:hypothetical protein